jgi:3-oxoacyl-(acyl-carrier-protein) synthase
MSRSTAITGVGVLWSGGTSLGDLVQAIAENRHALGKLSRVRAEDGSDLFGGAVDDRAIDARVAPAQRRTMDRFGRLNVAGATLTALDAGYTREAIDAGALSDAGLVLSTTFGPWESTNRFVHELIEEGPLGTSARIFPNTVLNSAQGRVAIDLKMRGPSSTICGLPALCYAFDLIALGRAERILAGGVDEIYPNQLTAYTADGTLAPQTPTGYLARPLDPESRGATAAEAFAACFCETEASARARGARVLARVLGYGVAPDSRLARGFAAADREGGAFVRAMEQALRQAETAAGQIDAVVAAANGCPGLDAGERTAIARVLGASTSRPVFPVKSITGECFGASASLGIAAAVGLLGARPELQRVLVNGVDIGGNHTSFVLDRSPTEGARA